MQNANVNTVDGNSNVVEVVKEIAVEKTADEIVADVVTTVDLTPSTTSPGTLRYVEGLTPSQAAIDPAFDVVGGNGDAVVPSQLDNSGGDDAPISRAEYLNMKTAVLILVDYLFDNANVIDAGNVHSNIKGLLGEPENIWPTEPEPAFEQVTNMDQPQYDPKAPLELRGAVPASPLAAVVI